MSEEVLQPYSDPDEQQQQQRESTARGNAIEKIQLWFSEYHHTVT